MNDGGKEGRSRRRDDAAAAAMGRKGGPARAKSLTAKRRKEIASEAAKARWADKDATKAKT